MKIVFATNNKHKLKEVREILDDKFYILSLKNINCFEDIPETQDTIEGNALQKARYVYEKYKVNCFADDTGLIVDAIDGEPGVRSARYSGEDCNSENNIKKVLFKINKKTNKNAHFKTVFALILNNKEYLFEGIVNGTIICKKRAPLVLVMTQYLNQTDIILLLQR